MNRIGMYILLTISLFFFAGFFGSPDSDSLLHVLKSEIKKNSIYDAQKESQLQELKKEFSNKNSGDFVLQYKRDSILFEEYRSYKYDSAFVYARRMHELSKAYHDQDRLVQSNMLLSNILLNSGMFKEAFDQLAEIDTTGMSPLWQSNYYILRARIYAGIAEYNNDAVYSKIYWESSHRDFRKAESANPPNAFERTLNLAFHKDSLKMKGLDADFFFQFITRHNLSPHSLAMACTRMSYAFEGADKIRFLTLAAIHDIRSSTKETLAILLLGQELFKAGHSADAYLCIQEAVRNGKFYGARGREVQIESVLPIIASKLLDEKQHERDQLLIGFLSFSIIAILLFFLLFVNRRQMRRILDNELIISLKNRELENVNEKLGESSRIKEEFIGLFFFTVSGYIETLEKLKRKVLHNIKLGNYQEANVILNQVHIERERINLYLTLDKMFLTLFPNFISSFNLLLRKEDQVWPKVGETLNASLRIFALMRLGIHELETIAKILNYSVSTVYTYKVRIKSKAIVPAEDFEKRVMEIAFNERK